MATQLLIEFANLKAYNHTTLVLQTKIWAKLNGLDEARELTRMRKKINKQTDANIRDIWEVLGGVLVDELAQVG